MRKAARKRKHEHSTRKFFQEEQGVRLSNGLPGTGSGPVTFGEKRAIGVGIAAIAAAVAGEDFVPTCQGAMKPKGSPGCPRRPDGSKLPGWCPTVVVAP